MRVEGIEVCWVESVNGKENEWVADLHCQSTLSGDIDGKLRQGSLGKCC